MTRYCAQSNAIGSLSGIVGRNPFRVALAWAALLASFVWLPARDKSSDPAAVVPREIGVLLLPVLDATADAANMQAPRRVVIRHREQFEFIARQFKVLGETLAIPIAATSPAIDLEAIAARTAKNLDELGRRAGADWVVNIVVQKVDANLPEEAEFKIHTQLLLQIRDVRHQTWLVDNFFAGQATGTGSPVLVFMHSLDDAAKVALSEILHAYPTVVSVESESSLKDYLFNQTEPLVAETGKPFVGPTPN